MVGSAAIAGRFAAMHSATCWRHRGAPSQPFMGSVFSPRSTQQSEQHAGLLMAADSGAAIV
jgi:hypothetical protein